VGVAYGALCTNPTNSSPTITISFRKYKLETYQENEENEKTKISVREWIFLSFFGMKNLFIICITTFNLFFFFFFSCLWLLDSNLILFYFLQVIFLALDVHVKNVACTYSLEHESIDDLFDSIFHCLEVLLEEKKINISKAFQEQHMLKEEEQVLYH
jgi:hypothetical protein